MRKKSDEKLGPRGIDSRRSPKLRVRSCACSWAQVTSRRSPRTTWTGDITETRCPMNDFKTSIRSTLPMSHKLKPAWVFHTGVSDPNMSMEMTPLVVNGVMYVPTGDDDVFAINAATGKQIWAYHPTDMPLLSTLPICCNNDNRGVAMGDGLIFVARLDATLIALDAATGKVVWKTVVDLSSKGAAMTIAPQFADNKVIVGVSGGEFAVRGHVDAYDPKTGKLIWRF